jgi:hypothetical protein
MKTTRAQLEGSRTQLDTENTVLSCALNDILNGDVKWFGHSRTFSIGVIRPASACGGIAVIRNNGTSRAAYCEQYFRAELAHISMCITGENTDYNRELLVRRSVIESAQAYLSERLRAA